MTFFFVVSAMFTQFTNSLRKYIPWIMVIIFNYWPLRKSGLFILKMKMKKLWFWEDSISVPTYNSKNRQAPLNPNMYLVLRLRFKCPKSTLNQVQLETKTSVSDIFLLMAMTFLHALED